MKQSWLLFGAWALTTTVPAMAAATFTTVDLSPAANRSWVGDWGVASFPTGAQTYNGTPFVIPGDALGARYASVYGTVPGSASGTFSIAVNIAHATTAYSLINTIWGQAQRGLIYIKFVGADGSSEQFNLLGGSDVRDFNNFAYTNTINDADAPAITTANAVTVDSGQHRLDEQTFSLAPQFLTDNIVSVVVTDNGADGFSRAALSGLTFGSADGTVPEPASWVLMLGGFGVVGATLRRRQGATRVAA